jgi:hypothetical protein
MKRALIAAALFGGLMTSAAAAPPTWQGDMFVTAVSNAANCTAVNVAVGDFYRTILRPKGLAADSGTADQIAFHSNRASIQLKPTAPTTTSLNGATAATVNVIYGSAGYNQFTGVPITATLIPYPVALATASVTITMTMNNVFSKPAPSLPSGCNITIRGVLGKRLS